MIRFSKLSPDDCIAISEKSLIIFKLQSHHLSLVISENISSSLSSRLSDTTFFRACTSNVPLSETAKLVNLQLQERNTQLYCSLRNTLGLFCRVVGFFVQIIRSFPAGCNERQLPYYLIMMNKNHSIPLLSLSLILSDYHFTTAVLTNRNEKRFICRKTSEVLC